MRTWLTPLQVAEMLQISPGTLANWRSRSTDLKPLGPRHRKVGRLVRYDADDVAEWMNTR